MIVHNLEFNSFIYVFYYVKNKDATHKYFLIQYILMTLYQFKVILSLTYFINAL